MSRMKYKNKITSLLVEAEMVPVGDYINVKGVVAQNPDFIVHFWSKPGVPDAQIYSYETFHQNFYPYPHDVAVDPIEKRFDIKLSQSELDRLVEVIDQARQTLGYYPERTFVEFIRLKAVVEDDLKKLRIKLLEAGQNTDGL